MNQREAMASIGRLTVAAGILFATMTPSPSAAQLSGDEGRTAPISASSSTPAREPVRQSETAVVERPARAAGSVVSSHQPNAIGRLGRAEEADPESRPLKSYKKPRSEPPMEGGSLF